MKKALIEMLVISVVYFPMLFIVRFAMNTAFPALHMTITQVTALYVTFVMFQLTYKAQGWKYKETV